MLYGVGSDRMQKFPKRLVLLIGGILAVDLLIPGAGSGELILQAVLIAFCGALMYFRQ
jgi:hypothetical protein